MLSILKAHPQWPAVAEIHSTLEKNGYKAFLAGGCVRDALLGREAHDLDLATDASPEAVESLFEKTVSVGKSFGVIRVLLSGQDIEVATFRRDLEYHDGRHPEGVVFSTPQEDAQRRDFTINALFYDLVSSQVVDYVQGQVDLQDRLIRTVGDPELRFSEDYLRILRAARFRGQLGFTIEETTLEQMKALKSKVRQVSGERIQEEIGKLLRSEFHQEALEVLATTGILNELFPFARSKRLQKGPLWYSWAQFLQETPKAEIESVFELYRFSNKDRALIQKYLEIFREPEVFLSARLGFQLDSLQSEGVRHALADIAWKNSLVVKQLQEAWRKMGEALPVGWVSGSDIKNLKGPAIGACLREVYYQQLEGRIKNRAEALALVAQIESQSVTGNK